MLEKIKELCKAKGIAICKMEEDLGLAQGYVYKLDKSSPSVDNAKKIADYLGTTVDELIK